MGFNIKNNYGPNIDNHDGGIVNLRMGRDGRWTVDAEEVEIIEEVEATDDGHHEQQHDSQPEENTAGGHALVFSESRQKILDQLLAWADRGDWAEDHTGEDVKAMLKTILGQGETALGGEARLSAMLWRLLENGRGDRVKVVWQNIVGYLDDRRLLKLKGSPALNKDFFGTEENYSNIDKGRPSRDNMSAGFRDILPLLDAYVPKVDKKA